MQDHNFRVTVKVHKGHEGEPCAQGFLYFGKKKIAEYSDDEHGGPMRILVLDAAGYKVFEEFVAKQELSYEMEGVTHQVTFEREEWVISQLVEETVEEKTLKRLCKTHLVFKKPGGSSWLTLKLGGRSVAEVVDILKNRGTPVGEVYCGHK